MYDDAARQRGEQEGTPVKKHFEEDDLWWWIMTILMRQKRFLPFFNDSNFMLSSQRQVVGGHQDHENDYRVETEETEETMISSSDQDLDDD